MTKAISYYSLKFPANSIIYIEQLRYLVDGEALKPDNLLKLVGADFSLADLLNGAKKIAK